MSAELNYKRIIIIIEPDNLVSYEDGSGVDFDVAWFHVDAPFDVDIASFFDVVA